METTTQLNPPPKTNLLVGVILEIIGIIGILSNIFFLINIVDSFFVITGIRILFSITLTAIGYGYITHKSWVNKTTITWSILAIIHGLFSILYARFQVVNYSHYGYLTGNFITDLFVDLSKDGDMAGYMAGIMYNLILPPLLILYVAKITNYFPQEKKLYKISSFIFLICISAITTILFLKNFGIILSGFRF
ncbi:MAG: hypothetical protein WC725_04570 [Patescibacteria group bacterium]|jgi:hypothetical protein